MSQMLSDEEIRAAYTNGWHSSETLEAAHATGLHAVQSAILAKLADLLKDAERYAWLRENSAHEAAYLEINGEIVDDRTIDAAIDAQKGQQ